MCALALAFSCLWGPVAGADPFGAPQAPDPMFGVNVNRIFNDGFATNWSLQLGAVQGAGIGFARSDAFWDQVEPNPPTAGIHHYSWSWEDLIAGSLRDHGIRWLPILDYSAPWAASIPGDTHSAPRSADDYAAYAAAFASRYGRDGSYWVANPTHPYTPVTTYEIWNEENGTFWDPGPDPAAYADLYLKARAAIKAVDPQARVLIGGLLPGGTFLADMYRSRPDLAGAVDGVAFHPYAASTYDVLASVRTLRQTLDGLDPNAQLPIYITELGWGTNGTDSPLVLTDQQRAAALAGSTDALARSDCGIQSILPYTWTTPERDPSTIEDWYGIYHWAGGPTATSEAYAGVIAHWGSDPATAGSQLAICHGPDSDGDGYPDAIDQCPTDPAIHDRPCSADLDVSQTFTRGRVPVGGTVSSTVSVTDWGPSPAQAATLTYSAGQGESIVSASPSSGTCTVAATVTCALGTIPRGAPIKVAIVVAGLAPGAVASTASVSAATGDPNPSNNASTATETVTAPPFPGLKLASRIVEVGPKRVASVAVRCPAGTAGGCAGTFRIARASVRAGRAAAEHAAAPFLLMPGVSGRIIIVLPRALAEAALRSRGLVVSVSAVAHDRFSTFASTVARIRLVPARSHRRR